MRGRNGTWHRYYYCRNHDPIRAGGQDRRCPERNIRADALDRFVFDQIRTVLIHPDLLVAGEHAVAVTTPIPDDELLAAELARLDRKIDAAEAERRRLVDIYQAGLVGLPDLQRRATEVAARLQDLRAKQANLADQRTTLARDNQLRRRLHDFAGRVRGIIDQLDDVQKQHLLRLLIEEVRVTGWHVQIRLRIPLDQPEPGRPTPDHPPTPSPLSTEDGLRSIGGHRRRQLPTQRQRPRPRPNRRDRRTTTPKMVNFQMPSTDQFSRAVDTEGASSIGASQED